MKRWLVRTLACVAIVVAGLAIAVAIHVRTPPTEWSGPPPHDWLSQIRTASGFEAWSRWPVVRFRFGGQNRYLWHKHLGWVRSERQGQVVWIDLVRDRCEDPSGPLAPAQCQETRDRFTNDAFWFFPLESLLRFADPPLQPKASAERRLWFHFASGGATPGDGYDVIFGEQWLITEWAMSVAILPVRGLRARFVDYQEIAGVNVSRLRWLFGFIPIRMDEVGFSDRPEDLLPEPWPSWQRSGH